MKGERIISILLVIAILSLCYFSTAVKSEVNDLKNEINDLRDYVDELEEDILLLSINQSRHEMSLTDIEDEDIPKEEIIEEETPEMMIDEIPELDENYLGKFKITYFCACSKCCGEYALNRPKDKNGKDVVFTASGKKAVPWYTIAADTNVLPFGTKVVIDGAEYEVMDTGSAVKGKVIDIYVGSSSDAHNEALERGCYNAEVYLSE